MVGFSLFVVFCIHIQTNACVNAQRECVSEEQLRNEYSLFTVTEIPRVLMYSVCLLALAGEESYRDCIMLLYTVVYYCCILLLLCAVEYCRCILLLSNVVYNCCILLNTVDVYCCKLLL